MNEETARPKEFSQDDDGRYWFSQTALNRYRRCPERARAYWMGEYADPPGVAAIVGSAVHAAMEASFAGLDTTQAIADAVAAEWTDGHDATHADWVTSGLAAEAALRAYTALRPTVKVNTPLGVESELRSAYSALLGFRGALDLVVDAHPGVMILDYKTSASSTYGRNSWELQRWAIQPTVYMWLASQAFNLPMSQVGFQFVVVDPKKLDVKRIPITRTMSDMNRLAAEALTAVDLWNESERRVDDPGFDPLYLGGISRWPYRPDGWWCGSRWCAHRTCPLWQVQV